MSDQDVELGFEGGELFRGLAHAEQAFKDVGIEIAQLTGAMNKVTKENKKYLSSVSGVTSKGENFRATFESVEKGIRLTGVALRAGSKDFQDYSAAAKQAIQTNQGFTLASTPEQRQGQHAFNQIVGSTNPQESRARIDRGSQAEQKRFQDSLARLREFSIANGRMADDVLQIHRDLEQGIVRSYSGGLKTAQDLLINVREDYGKLGTEASRAANKAKDQQKKSNAELERTAILAGRAEDAISQITDSSTRVRLFSDLDSVGPTASVQESIRRATNEQNKSRKAVEQTGKAQRGLVSEYTNAIRAVESIGNTTKENNLLEKLRNGASAKYIQALVEQDKLSTRNAAKRKREQKKSNAELERTTILAGRAEDAISQITDSSTRIRLFGDLDSVGPTASVQESIRRATDEQNKSRKAVEQTAKSQRGLVSEYTNAIRAVESIGNTTKENNLLEKLRNGASAKYIQALVEQDKLSTRNAAKRKREQEAEAKRLRDIDKIINNLKVPADRNEVRGRIAAQPGIKFQAEQIREMTKDMEQANKRANSLRLSLSEIARIATISGAYRFVFGLTEALRDANAMAIELQNSIAEILTISAPTDSFEQWQRVLIDTSNSFPLDVLEQAEIAYQALSNQLINSTGDSQKFLTTVNELALVTKSDGRTAVDALSGAINAYSFNVGEADVVSAKLFATVERGRLRLEDLADIGNVSILGNQLGASFDDLLATISTLTIQGLKPTESLTQLRGIMVKLLKPTEEMQSLLDELGFESAQVGVQTLGLAGFIREIGERSQGSTSEIAKLINNIRGLSGIVGLQGSGAATFRENLEALQDIELGTDSLDNYRRNIENVTQSTGVVIKQAATQIQNDLLEILVVPAQNALRTLTNDFKIVTAGAEGLLKAFTLLGPAIGVTAVIAIGKYVSSLGLVTKVLAALRPHPVILGLTLVTTAVTFLRRQIGSSTERIQENLNDLNQSFAENLNEINLLVKARADQIKASFQLATSGIFEVTGRIIKQSREGYAELEDSATSSLEEVVKSQKEYETRVKSSNKAIQRSYKDTTATVKSVQESLDSLLLQQEIGSRQFEFSLLGQNDKEKIAAIGSRIESLQSELEKAAQAGDTKRFNEFQAERQRLFDQRVGLISTEIEDRPFSANERKSQIQRELNGLVAQEISLRNRLLKSVQATNEVNRKAVEEEKLAQEQQREKEKRRKELADAVKDLDFTDIADTDSKEELDNLFANFRTDLSALRDLNVELGIDTSSLDASFEKSVKLFNKQADIIRSEGIQRDLTESKTQLDEELKNLQSERTDLASKLADPLKDLLQIAADLPNLRENFDAFSGVRSSEFFLTSAVKGLTLEDPDLPEVGVRALTRIHDSILLADRTARSQSEDGRGVIDTIQEKTAVATLERALANNGVQRQSLLGGSSPVLSVDQITAGIADIDRKIDEAQAKSNEVNERLATVLEEAGLVTQANQIRETKVLERFEAVIDKFGVHFNEFEAFTRERFGVRNNNTSPDTQANLGPIEINVNGTDNPQAVAQLVIDNLEQRVFNGTSGANIAGVFNA